MVQARRVIALRATATAVSDPTEVEAGLTLSGQSGAAGQSEDVPLQTSPVGPGVPWAEPAAVAPRQLPPWEARA